MAVTSWTSEGMDWDNLQLKPFKPYPFLEALRLALIERLAVASDAFGLGGITGTEYFLNVFGSEDLLTEITEDDNTHLSIWPADWFKQFDTVIRALVGNDGSQYSNWLKYADSGGDWDGYGTYPYTKKFPPTYSGNVDYPSIKRYWYKPQLSPLISIKYYYDIINNMRWFLFRSWGGVYRPLMKWDYDSDDYWRAIFEVINTPSLIDYTLKFSHQLYYLVHENYEELKEDTWYRTSESTDIDLTEGYDKYTTKTPISRGDATIIYTRPPGSPRIVLKFDGANGFRFKNW